MATWPTLEGLEPNVKRRQIYATDIFESDGGSEVRHQTYAVPKYEYDLSYACLRTDVIVSASGQAYDGMSELGAFLFLFSSAAGSLGTHTFTEPTSYGGSTRTVRYKDDSLEVTQVSDTVYSASLTLRTVNA